MRNIINKVLLVALGVYFISCSKEFLDTSSTDSYNEANWWLNESQVISTINGCYTTLREDMIGGLGHFRSENITPNSYNQSGEINLALGSHSPGNTGSFRSKWNANYEGIGRVNTLLGNIDKVDLGQEIGERIRGEAYFLRAYFYSNLVDYYGGVPLILEEPDFKEHGKLPRNTNQEVVNQVLDDLDRAENMLPVSYSGSDIGRATKGAAMALKARVLLYESRWTEAAQAAKNVMDMNHYSLFSDYRELFLPENEGNSEVIFDVQYKAPEYANTLDNLLEVQMNLAPLLNLVNSYQMIDGKSIEESPMYDPDAPFENRDPRLKKTIVSAGHTFRGRVVSDSKYFATGFGFKKYTTYRDDVAQPDILQSEINFIVLRYADVLLMYAEATNEATGPDESVHGAINLIRARAGMPDIPAGLDQGEMRKAIRHERRIELVAEALYYSDIRRWGIAEEVMNGDVYNSKGEVVQTRSFNPDRDYLWPIHEITIQENPELNQNPGY